MDSPYNYFQYTVLDAADALIFLDEQWGKGYEYVEGLPRFGVGGRAARQEDVGTIVTVLFKERPKE